MVRVGEKLKAAFLAIVSVIGAIIGAGWVKRKLEQRGADKQRRKQEELADRTEEAIRDADEGIDEEANEQLGEIAEARAALAEETAERIAGTPTRDAVKSLIEESKE